MATKFLILSNVPKHYYTADYRWTVQPNTEAGRSKFPWAVAYGEASNGQTGKVAYVAATLAAAEELIRMHDGSSVIGIKR